MRLHKFDSAFLLTSVNCRLEPGLLKKIHHVVYKIQLQNLLKLTSEACLKRDEDPVLTYIKTCIEAIRVVDVRKLS